ncbi:MAG: GAF domain-containing protein, partial [Myxococcota bacterium]
ETRLRLISEATTEFSAATRDSRLLLDVITRKLSQAVGELCAVRLVSRDGEWLETIGSAHHPDPDIVAAALTLIRKPTRAGSPGIVGRVAETMQSVLVPQIDPATFMVNAPAEQREVFQRIGVHSVLAVPLLSDGRALGVVLMVRGSRSPAYGPDDLRLVEDLGAQAAIAVANSRLLDGSARMASRMRLLSELTHEFSRATGDHLALVELIARRVGEVIGEACSIRLLSPGSDLLTSIDGLYHPDPVVLEEWRTWLVAHPQRIDDGLTGRALATGRGVLVQRTSPDELAPTGTSPRGLVERLAIHSLMAVPLRSEGQPIGVAVMLRSDPNDPYLPEDLTLLEELGAHASIAITTSRILAKLQRELTERSRLAERLRLLSELTREFAATTGDYRGLLELVARRLSETIGEACSIRMVAPGGQWFESESATYHPDPDVTAALRRCIRTYRQRADEGVIGSVLTSGRSLLVPDTSPEMLTTKLSSLQARLNEVMPVRSLLIVLLRAEGKPIGTAMMTRSAPGDPFTPEDLALLEDVAAHASIAITNSRLLDAAQRELNDRKRAEAALRGTEEQLRQAQKMEAVGRLAGGVAHDFNNLLTVILSYVSLLLDRPPSPEQLRVDLGEVKHASERAADLTRQLLAFSRQQVTQPRVLDMGDTIESMAKMIQRLIGEDIDYRSVRAPDLGRVKVDPGHIEQVLMNLVVNARDAMPRGGKLTIETQNIELDEGYASQHHGVTAGAYVMVAVSDTGVGMDKATQLRIFEPFFTTKEVGKGTGLGLSTVFGIVAQSGGHVAVYSEPGHGATFKVYFPRTDEPVRAITPTAPTTRPSAGETLLLVEDDEQLRAVARGVLQEGGFRVLEARNGREGLEVAERHLGVIHLLVTDVVMPQMGGRELAERLVAGRRELEGALHVGLHRRRHRAPRRARAGHRAPAEALHAAHAARQGARGAGVATRGRRDLTATA